MRRKIIILSATLIIVLVIQIGASTFTHRVVDKALADAVEIRRAVLNLEWDQAKEYLQPLDDSWDEACRLMDWWIASAKMESIHASLRELSVLLDAHDYPHSLLLIEKLRDDLMDIAQWGELSFSNVV
ncbi:hypothetical protein AGMMS49992_26670 [Clostridia bacterium]|nr:hypothetical protein AGMMS49992_26670 [Clostridia bacterium]